LCGASDVIGGFGEKECAGALRSGACDEGGTLSEVGGDVGCGPDLAYCLVELDDEVLDKAIQEYIKMTWLVQFFVQSPAAIPVTAYLCFHV
jgi:hypothetical protein